MNTIKTYYYMTNCYECGFNNRFTIEIKGYDFIDLISSYIKKSDKKYNCEFCEKETGQKIVTYGL
ncbi:hypothetical protein SAMN05660862_2272 [Sphingobacterium psychroaquaticum]|uniref:Uncharacterized protein n=1 Tax=Sphingobacterium psychroaquaticum TaxID=561061 RepID=A0A1X7JW14_9SPHI|nr:hypothetical protein SAMN05660862_2272 [Sphingobacterium psychroaquaticum]